MIDIKCEFDGLVWDSLSRLSFGISYSNTTNTILIIIVIIFMF